MSDLQDVEERFERARERAASSRWQDVILSLSQAGPEIDEVPDALYLLSEAYYRQGQPLKSRETADRAFRGFEAKGNDIGRWRSANMGGLAEFEMGNFDEAEVRLQRVRSILETLDDPDRLAGIWNNLGMLRTVQEKMEEALACYSRSLEISTGTGNQKIQMDATYNRAMCYRNMKEWDLADQSFADACRLAQATGTVTTLGLAITERAHIARRRGNAAGAEQMARMAMLRFDTISNSAGLAEVYKLLGIILRERSALAEAEEYLEKAKQLNVLIDNPLTRAEILLELGLLYRDLGRGAEAEASLRAAVEGFEALGRKGQAEETRALLTPELVAAG